MSTFDTPSLRVRPTGWWYLLVPALLIMGVGFAIAAGIDEAGRIGERFDLLGDDGRGSIDLDAGEEATVWAVWEDGRSTDSLSRPPATVEVRGPSGEVVFDPRSSSGTTTWSFGSGSGIDVGAFTATEAGRYEVEVEFTDGRPAVDTSVPPDGAAQDPSVPPGGTGTDSSVPPGTQEAPPGFPVAAVGSLDLSSSVGNVVRPFLLALAGAVGLTVLLMVLRGRSKRRVRRAASGSALGVDEGSIASSSVGPSGHDGPFS